MLNLHKVVLATKNRHKIKEISAILKKLEIKEIQDFNTVSDTPEIEETGKTFYDNALLKAKTVYTYTGLPALADDSGLCVPALNNKPGVNSARYAGAGATSAMLIAKLLENMKKCKGDQRKAFFHTVMLLYLELENRRQVIIKGAGRINGRITTQPAGSRGFGYDPVFIPDGYNQTFAQLTPGAKNRISHRARALSSFYDNFLKCKPDN